ncbi:MAG: hypothetical protein JNN07_02865 [Verrucomicrobiales bacterium]|nr:hypothetical protein [Verrucomicrobiales bacterium]
MATIDLVSSQVGRGEITVDFLTSNSGLYSFDSISFPGLNQTGEFLGASVNALGSLSGLTISCAIQDGISPFSSAGNFRFLIPSTGNRYRIQGEIGIPDSAGTYSYTLVNRSTARMRISDSLIGTADIYVGFFGSRHGGYALRTASGSFQLGEFTIPDEVPPTLTFIAPTAGQRWSNSVFRVEGRAADNDQVDAVFYRVNGSDWSPASTLDQWASWSADAVLNPGSNLIEAYAKDVSNNTSTIPSRSLVYIVTAPMAVQITGKGAISPNHDGKLLEFGKTYSMTATPGPGYAFSGWTGSRNTNAATIVFTMEVGYSLSANFTDVGKPLITITQPKQNQIVSNAVAIAIGSSSDNSQVSKVWLDLNGQGWKAASSTNTFTQWTSELLLSPGTNSLRAYSEDPSGNHSTTGLVRFTYVPSDFLRIQSIGRGSLTPNYSNALLQIGKLYSVTANGVGGFAFTNWVISTNFTEGHVSNANTLKFLMQSNLTLVANFKDITKPTLSIQLPTANQRFSNAIATVKGTTTDNFKVAMVYVQNGSGPWQLAASTNQYTNWSSTALLSAGTNTIRAYSVDQDGNRSITNTVRCTSPSSFMLQLSLERILLPTTGTEFHLLLNASSNLLVQVESSTNLVSWSTITTLRTSNATVRIADEASTTNGWRFYRAQVP